MTTGPGPRRSTRLDDLLGYDDPRRAAKPRRSPVAMFVWRSLLGMVVGFLVWELLRHNGVGVPFVLVVTVVLVINCLKVLLDWSSMRPLPETLRDTAPHALPRVERDDGIRTAAWRWELRIDWTSDDLPRFAAVVQRSIADLVDERLRLRHSVTLADNPQQARELVGPQLWQFITEPVRRPVKPQELAALVARMEQI